MNEFKEITDKISQAMEEIPTLSPGEAVKTLEAVNVSLGVLRLAHNMRGRLLFQIEKMVNEMKILIIKKIQSLN